MNHIKLIITVSALLLGTTSVFAASHAGAPMAKDPVKTEAAPAAVSGASGADMADAEVRKVDKETKKITLKHGLIKNLDMPGMTMVFAVKDAAMMDNLKAGDKIKFKAEQTGSAITVTEIQPIK